MNAEPSTINIVIDYLKQIPAVVGVIIGSMATIVGSMGATLLSNWDSRRRLKIQFKNDAEQRDREREMDMRREVYFEAAQAIAKAQENISLIPSMDLQALSQKLSEESFFPATSKVHLIGSQEVIIAMERFIQKFNIGIMTLFPKKLYLVDIYNQIKDIINQIDTARSSWQNTAQQIQSIAKTKENEPYLATLSGRLAETQKAIEGLMQKQQDLQGHASDVFYKLVEETATISRETLATLPECVLAVRKDIQIKIDEKAYRDLTIDAQQKQQKRYDQYIKDIQNLLRKK